MKLKYAFRKSLIVVLPLYVFLASCSITDNMNKDSEPTGTVSTTSSSEKIEKKSKVKYSLDFSQTDMKLFTNSLETEQAKDIVGGWKINYESDAKEIVVVTSTFEEGKLIDSKEKATFKIPSGSKYAEVFFTGRYDDDSAKDSKYTVKVLFDSVISEQKDINAENTNIQLKYASAGNTTQELGGRVPLAINLDSVEFASESFVDKSDEQWEYILKDYENASIDYIIVR